MCIKNKKELLSQGYKKLREDGLSIVSNALYAVDPYVATKILINLKRNVLSIGSLHIDLSKKNNIYILGGGKAVFPIAKALEEILIEKITEGLIVVKEGHQGILKKIKIRIANHPLPNKAGFYAAQEIKKIAEKAQEKDLVFWINTGGISALAPLPVSPITPEEKILVHQLLLLSGANIKEINTVRSHLSDIKGGRLALSIFPAEIINLIVSDNPGDPLNVGPTGLDYTTFPEAISILKLYGLWDKFPESAKEYLLTATPELETPKNFGKFKSLVHSFILVKNNMACQGAIDKAKELGFNSLFLSSCIEGESREVAKVHAAIGKEVISTGNPISRPACLVSGGETVVTVKGNGLGGSNLEFALAAAIEIEGTNDIVILSLGTDGTDGPTDAAGAIVDGDSINRAKKLGLNSHEYLKQNDSYNFFKKLNDLIITGPTGTNVMDIRLVLIR
jgi:glycerate-2-kinase